MKRFQFSQQQKIDRPIDEVFKFFSDARNLERITPPWLKFKVLTPEPIELKQGALIDYRLRVHGLPLRWRSEITAWDPPHYFVDEQRKGPYKLWIHRHTFAEQDGGVLAKDHVEYAVPGGTMMNTLFVKHDLARIFKYRKQVLDEIFARESS